MAEKNVAEPVRLRRERALAQARERSRDRLVEAYLRALNSDAGRRPSRGELRAILVDTEPRP
jgi:hypothetical protein